MVNFSVKTGGGGGGGGKLFHGYIRPESRLLGR